MRRMIGNDAEALEGAMAGEAAAVPEAARRPLRELMDDRLPDPLLEGRRFDEPRCGPPMSAPKPVR